MADAIQDFDPMQQRAQNVREMRARMKLAHEHQQRLLTQGYRPFAHEPEEWAQMVDKKPKMFGQNGERQPTPGYTHGFGPPANQGMPPGQRTPMQSINNNPEAAMQLAAALQQRQRNSPAALGPGLRPNMAFLPPQAEQHVQPTGPSFPEWRNNEAHRESPLNMQGKLTDRQRREMTAKRDQWDTIAEQLNIDPKEMTEDQFRGALRSNKGAYQQALAQETAYRRGNVENRQMARAAVRNFGVAPEAAYALHVMPGQQQGGQDRAKTAMRFMLMGFTPEQAWAAATYDEQLRAKQIADAEAGLAQSQTPEAIQHFQDRLDELRGGGQGAPQSGSGNPVIRNRRETSETVKEALKLHPDNPLAAADHIANTLAVSPQEADEMLRRSGHKHAKRYNRQLADAHRQGLEMITRPYGPLGALLRPFASWIGGTIDPRVDEMRRGIMPQGTAP